MVHDEDDSCLFRDAGKHLVIGVGSADSVDGLGQRTGNPNAKAEIRKGREPGHNFTRIRLRLLKSDVLRNIVGLGVIDNLARDLWVIDQPLYHIVPLRQLHRLDGPREPLVEPRDSALEPAAEKPPDRWQQQMAQCCHRCKQHDQDKEP